MKVGKAGGCPAELRGGNADVCRSASAVRYAARALLAPEPGAGPPLRPAPEKEDEANSPHVAGRGRPLPPSSPRNRVTMITLGEPCPKPPRISKETDQAAPDVGGLRSGPNFSPAGRQLEDYTVDFVTIREPLLPGPGGSRGAAPVDRLPVAALGITGFGGQRSRQYPGPNEESTRGADCL